MQKSVSRKTATIVSASLSLTLIVMVTAMLWLENSAMMNSTDQQVHDVNDLLVKSLTFSMSQGATDLGEFVDSVKRVRGLVDLKVLPSAKVRKVAAAAMDRTELRVLSSGHPVAMKETYRDQPVYRLIEPVVANRNCSSCHVCRSGDVLAVVSLRYSLAGMESSLAAQRTTGIVFALIAIGVTLLMSMYFIRKKIIDDLEISIGDIRKLSEGDTSEIADIKREDEIGNLNLSLKKLQQSLNRRAEMGVRFAEGNFGEEVVLLSDKDVLGKAFAKIRERLKSLVSDAKSLSVAAVEGRLRERADSGKHDGEFREIIVNFNDTLDAIVLPITESSRVLETMSKGDLTVRMQGEYRGDYAIIRDSINTLADSFSAAIANVSKAVYSTSASAGEISSSAEQMAVGAHEQSLQAAEVASSVEEMTRTIFETTRNAGTAAESAKEAGEIAKEGGGAVSDTIVGMNRIAERVRKSAESIQALGKSGEEIGRIIQVIDDIADQTNLLALNAAIEAARAGDQGRGFAVVADEVRKLAERTTGATKEISAMIKKIQDDTTVAVESMDEGTSEVEKGKVLTDKAGQSLQRIIASAEKVVDVVTQVASASEEQAASAEQISRSIESISNVTQESAGGVQQIAHASEDLSKLTANLQAMISRFRHGKQGDGRDSAPGRTHESPSVRTGESDFHPN